MIITLVAGLTGALVGLLLWSQLRTLATDDPTTMSTNSTAALRTGGCCC
jgi:hypothetical protein